MTGTSLVEIEFSGFGMLCVTEMSLGEILTSKIFLIIFITDLLSKVEFSASPPAFAALAAIVRRRIKRRLSLFEYCSKMSCRFSSSQTLSFNFLYSSESAAKDLVLESKFTLKIAIVAFSSSNRWAVSFSISFTAFFNVSLIKAFKFSANRFRVR